MIKTKFSILSIALALVLACSGMIFSACGNTHTTAQGSGKATEAVTEAETNADITPVAEGAKAIIDVKDYGKITVELYPDIAPITVSNFVTLAKSGFYDGLTFHRIMEGFMIQGGDPLGNGTGGSEQNIYGEFAANNFENNLSHTRGVISMARNGFDYNSASSQFFIVHEDSTFLDGQYASFGKVVDGMDVVDKIATDAKPVDDNGTIPSSKQPVINSVTIEE